MLLWCQVSNNILTVLAVDLLLSCQVISLCMVTRLVRCTTTHYFEHAWLFCHHCCSFLIPSTVRAVNTPTPTPSPSPTSCAPQTPGQSSIQCHMLTYQLDIFDMHCSKLFKISCLSSVHVQVSNWWDYTSLLPWSSFIMWYTLYSTQDVVNTCSACDNKNLYRKVNVVCGHVIFL